MRRFAKRRIADLIDSREPQLLAGIVTDLRIVNGQRGRVAIFRLDDKSESIESVVAEDLLNQSKELLRDDELIIVQGKVQPDRFSGGVRLNISQVWDLAEARCRFGKHLRIEIGARPPAVERLLQEFPARRSAGEHGESVQGLGVRVVLRRDRARAEIDLGDDGRFFPSDEALGRWREASGGRAQVVYEISPAGG